MSSWPIRNCYGFGAARLCVAAPPYARPADSIVEDLRQLVRELGGDGLRAGLRRALAVAPALALCLTLLLAVGLTVTSDRVDATGVELVMLRSDPTLQVIEVETPAPPELPKPEIEAPEPAPQPVAPKLPPKPRAAPEPRPTPPPKPPRVEMDAFAQAAMPAPAPAVRRGRDPTRRAAQTGPDVHIDPVAAQSAALSANTPTSRAREFASVTRTTRSRPVALAMDGVDARSQTQIAGVPTRGQRAPRQRPGSVAGPRPALASPGAPKLGARAAAPSERPIRAGRSIPQLSRAGAAPALLAPPSFETGPAPLHAQVTETARAQGHTRKPPQGPERAGQDTPLRGVPLGSLASCVSDREEDALKQRLLAAVTTQKECVSQAGRYRFLETRNLNAFLMWVDSAPGRAQADRCVELALALDCVLGRTGER